MNSHGGASFLESVLQGGALTTSYPPAHKAAVRDHLLALLQVRGGYTGGGVLGGQSRSLGPARWWPPAGHEPMYARGTGITLPPPLLPPPLLPSPRLARPRPTLP